MKKTLKFQEILIWLPSAVEQRKDKIVQEIKDKLLKLGYKSRYMSIGKQTAYLRGDARGDCYHGDDINNPNNTIYKKHGSYEKYDWRDFLSTTFIVSPETGGNPYE